MTRGVTDGDDSGFIAIDGLVALTVVAIVLVLVMNAAALTLRSSRAAAERRSMVVEAEYRLLSEVPNLDQAGTVSGNTKRGSWSLGVALRELRGDTAICDVTLVVREARRRVVLETAAFCPRGQQS
jgi:hypothetical protein